MVDALWMALLAGGALACMSGPLGCVIIWRRMAYFGDAMAHAALLGVAMALLFDALPLPALVFAVSALAAVMLRVLMRDTTLHADTALGMIAHGALALGIVLISMFGDASVGLEDYLIGDILSLSWPQVVAMLVAAFTVCIVLAIYWRQIVMLVLDSATARLHGVPVAFIETGLVMILALLVAMAIQLVGVLLLTAMLIMPAAAAGNIAQSPGRMAAFASLFGVTSVALGLYAAVQLDTPPAPTMVVVASLLFVISRVFKRA